MKPEEGMDTKRIPANDGCGLFIRAGGSHTSMSLISEAIEDKLDVNRFLAFSNSINIADLGCSLAFVAVKNIVESVKRKTPNDKREEIEFQVFFNDHVFDRFDTLLRSLPSDRQYFAAAVPGSIHGRLFPKGALHFVNSSYALYWLSKIPDELIDKESPSFNKGRIFYTNSCSKVVEAYATQFTRDMEAFLNARAEELVSGGLMALLLPCFEVDRCPLVEVVELLGDCLMEMTYTGFVSEDKVDSFNFPRYNANMNEVKDIIDRNDRFKIEKLQRLEPPTSADKAPSIHIFMLFLQTSWKGMIENHFGREITNQVFRLLRKRIMVSSILNEANMNSVSECFILLQKKVT